MFDGDRGFPGLEQESTGARADEILQQLRDWGWRSAYRKVLAAFSRYSTFPCRAFCLMLMVEQSEERCLSISIPSTSPMRRPAARATMKTMPSCGFRHFASPVMALAHSRLGREISCLPPAAQPVASDSISVDRICNREAAPGLELRQRRQRVLACDTIDLPRVESQKYEIQLDRTNA
jgi:hypothetical protein